MLPNGFFLPRLTIRQLQRLLASGALSSEQLCSYCYTLAYAGEHIWKLHAFERLLPKEEIVEQARAADDRRKHLTNASQQSSSSSASSSWLEGIPVSIKANIAVSSLPLTAGSRILGAHLDSKSKQSLLSSSSPPAAANYHADVTEALLVTGGAVLMGTTRMDEFGMGSLGMNNINDDDANSFALSLSTKNPRPFTNMLQQKQHDMSDEQVLEIITSTDPNRILEAHDSVQDQYQQDDDNLHYYSAGGSSCGSAASVAHGSSIASLGTDTGGSVRLPAAWCRITGLRPSYGLLSRHGLVSYASSMDTPGILAPSADCAAIVLNVLLQQGDVEKDSNTDHNIQRSTLLQELSPSSKSIASSTTTGSRPLDGMRVGIPVAFSVEECPQSVLEMWSQTVETLESLGASIESISAETISPTVIQKALSAYYVLACAEASSNLARYDGFRYGVAAIADPSDESTDVSEPQLSVLQEQYTMTRSAGFGKEVKRRILSGTAVLSSDRFHTYYEAAANLRADLTEQLHSALQSCDMLLVPTNIFPPVALNQPVDPTEMLANDIMTVPASLAGLPAISITRTVQSDDIAFPSGMQLIGSRMGEATMLRAAMELERINGINSSKSTN